MFADNGYLEGLICTDSKTALSKLDGASLSKDIDFITLETKQMILNSQIALMWVPGHDDVSGNVRADNLAKLGTNLNVPLDTKVDIRDFLPKVKTDVFDEYKLKWKEMVQTAGRWYSKVQSEYPSTPFYKKFPNLNKRHITSIIRLRTGHGLYKKHLFRIGLADDPFCDCGQTEDLDHIFLECPINKIDNLDIYNECIKEKILTPINMISILRNLNNRIIMILITYMEFNKINI